MGQPPESAVPLGKRRIDLIYKGKFDTFYGGIPDDIRIQSGELAASVQHFDIFTNPKRLVPFRNMIDDGEDLAFAIINFLYANSVHYGQGVVSSTTKNKIFYKNSDPITGTWTAAASGSSSGGARNDKLFKEFHNYIYLAAAGTNRIQYFGDITGSPSFNETAFSLDGSGLSLPTAQAIITSDDLLLVPCANSMVVKDGAGSGPTNAWSVGLTLPSDQTIVDHCEFGDMVAIGTQPVNGFPGGKNSKVHLWDKKSTDVSQTIDFGEGSLYHLENIEGTLVAILTIGGNTFFGIKPKLVVRQWTGGTKANVIKEIQADNNTTIQLYGNNCKIKKGNILIFPVSMTINGLAYLQFMSFGRKNANYPFALQFDRKIDDDRTVSAVQGAAALGDYIFVGHNSDGSVNRTNDQNQFGVGDDICTAAFITPKITGLGEVPDSHRKNKNLVLVGVLTAPLVSGNIVKLYYRKDGDTSWTLIRTYSYGDDATGMGFEQGVDANGDSFPNFREVQFKATSNGGAEILSVLYGWKLAGAEAVSE